MFYFVDGDRNQHHNDLSSDLCEDKIQVCQFSVGGNVESVALTVFATRVNW